MLGVFKVEFKQNTEHELIFSDLNRTKKNQVKSGILNGGKFFFSENIVNNVIECVLKNIIMILKI